MLSGAGDAFARRSHRRRDLSNPFNFCHLSLSFWSPLVPSFRLNLPKNPNLSLPMVFFSIERLCNGGKFRSLTSLDLTQISFAIPSLNPARVTSRQFSDAHPQISEQYFIDISSGSQSGVSQDPPISGFIYSDRHLCNGAREQCFLIFLNQTSPTNLSLKLISEETISNGDGATRKTPATLLHPLRTGSIPQSVKEKPLIFNQATNVNPSLTAHSRSTILPDRLHKIKNQTPAKDMKKPPSELPSVISEQATMFFPISSTGRPPHLRRRRSLDNGKTLITMMGSPSMLGLMFFGPFVFHHKPTKEFGPPTLQIWPRYDFEETTQETSSADSPKLICIFEASLARKPPITMIGIIGDILKIVKSFYDLSFRFILRSDTMFVDDLARTAVRSMTIGHIFSLYFCFF